MAGAKDPRSMMIGMMYLVLMALLALNVSSEVMNAFRILNESLETSITSITNKNDLLFSQFDKEIKAQGEFKVRPYKEKAQKMRTASKQTVDYINSLIKKVIAASDPKPNGTYKESDLNASSRIFVEEGEGDKLKGNLQKIIDLYGSLINPEDKIRLMKSLSLKLEMPKPDPEKGEETTAPSWASLHFHGMASIGGITILNKFKNDIVNVEGSLIEYLLNKIDALDIKFDKFEPLINANSTYLMLGQKFEATIAVGAFSSTSQPRILVNGVPLPVRDGKATYVEDMQSPGKRIIRTTVVMRLPDGRDQPFNKDIEINVGIPSGPVVTADKVNVLYRGIENPVTVSSGPVGQERIKVAMTNCKFSGSGSSYNVIPGDGPETAVSVSIDGKTSVYKFRVKDIPPPVPAVGEFSGGLVPTAQFKAEGGLRALLKDFLFEGLNFTVVGYKIGGNGPGFDGFRIENNEGGRWVNRAKGIVDQAKPGALIYIDDIQVKGPDGKVRKLNSIAFKLK